MNVKLLEQVRDYIGSHPEKFNQAEWCGSACCVAGHVVKLSGGIPTDLLAFDVAASELDINEGQASRLFSATWCLVAHGQFAVSSLMTPEERSEIAVKRINHFIKTGGAE